MSQLERALREGIIFLNIANEGKTMVADKGHREKNIQIEKNIFKSRKKYSNREKNIQIEEKILEIERKIFKSRKKFYKNREKYFGCR